MGELNKSDVEWIQFYLRKLPFVQWDRFVEFETPKIVGVYGWIERPQDKYKDFVYIEFVLEKHIPCYIASSSEEYSERIFSVIETHPGAIHKECKRVEEYFPVPNCVRLTEKKENLKGNTIEKME